MERLEISNARLRAEAIPALGGRLSRLQFRAGDAWRDALVPIGPDPTLPPRWPKGGAYPLVPYSNRIADARLHHDGQIFALAPHPDALPHTLHGHAHLRAWQVRACSADALTLGYVHAPDPHWPWAFDATQRFWLEKSALGLAIAVKNTDARPAPIGIGWHPYFPIAGDPAVALDVKTEWLQNAANVATGAIVAAPAGELVLDAQGSTRYLGEWQGRAAFETGTGIRIALHADARFAHIVVHRPANIDYLCLEPVSHVANGFNLAAAGQRGTGTTILQPGESIEGQLKLALA